MRLFTEEKDSARNITWASIGVNSLLVGAKGAAGLLAHSTALLADALHSLTDIASDILVLFGLRFGRLGEDENHPYGHYRFNTIAEFCIGLLLALFAAGLFIDATGKMIQGKDAVPGILAFWVATASLLVKEILFWTTRRIARRTRSRLLMANAWHHRTDSLSSLLVVIALLIAWLGGPGWGVADKIAGMSLSALLFAQGIKILGRAGNDLLDGAPGQDVLDDLREHILPIRGVVGYHKFRARRVGDFLEVDLHVQVEARQNIHDAHEIGKEVRAKIINDHPEVVDVLVHLEPAVEETLVRKGISDFDPTHM